MAADHTEEDDVEAVRPSPHRKRVTTPPRSALTSTAVASVDDDENFDALLSALLELPHLLKKAIRERKVFQETMPYVHGCRKAGKQHATAQGAAYEKLPYLNHADMTTEDERTYVPPQVTPFNGAVSFQYCLTRNRDRLVQSAWHMDLITSLRSVCMQRRQVCKAGRKSRQVDNGKAEAIAALAMKASKRNSVFSTMSARSLCSDDERAASYGAVDKVAPLAVDILVIMIMLQPAPAVHTLDDRWSDMLVSLSNLL